MKQLTGFVVLALLSVITVFGQSTSGIISGILEDSRSTRLEGAAVTVTDSAHNISRTVTSNKAGMFAVPQLQPGVYTITVEKESFKKLVTTQVVLTVTTQLSVGNLILEPGSAAETITRTADPGQFDIQSTSGERSGLLTNVDIRDLSLNGRNMLDLLVILPGIVSFVNGQVSSTSGLNLININGARGNQHELTIDGSSNVNTLGNSALHVTINPDAVAEVKVLAANYQAEYGRSAGGFMQFVTKSGTRDFHGTARFFHRHEGLNANNYFRNAQGRSPDGSEIQPRPLYRYNYQGYDIGGPVPLGEGKNKLFFYWNQEFYRQLVPPTARNLRVPTAAERRGDFSQTTIQGAAGTADMILFVRDPDRAGVCNQGVQTACFPGNIIPENRFFQDGQAILNLYPLPNVSGDSRFNYTSSLSNNYPRREDILRVDGDISPRTRLSVRYINNTESQLQPYGSGNFVLSPILIKGRGENGALSLTHSFSPTLANEFIFGPSSGRIASAVTDEKATRKANKITFPLFFPTVNDSDMIPNFAYGGLVNVTALPTANFTGLPIRNVNHTFDFSDNVSKVWGAHVMKTGVFIQRSRTDRSATEPVASNINFANNSNNPLNTNYPFSNVLLGIYNTYQQASNSPRSFFRYTNIEGYVQDNWRVTPRLTLDYGMRVAWYQPQYESRLQSGFFNPALYNPVKSVRLYEPVTIAGNQQRAVDPANRPLTPTMANTFPSSFIASIVQGSGDTANGIGRTSEGNARAGFDSRGAQWGPRFGFAYNLFGKGRSVLRGGFGIFYDRVAASNSFASMGNPPAVLRPVLSFGRLQELTSNSAVLGPPDVFGVATDGHVPSVYSASLGVQHEVGFNTVLDVAYVGTLSRHLMQTRNLNAVPYGTGFTREAQDPTLFPGSTVPDSEFNLPEVYRLSGLRFSGVFAKRVEFLRPIPGYGNIQYAEFAGSANYHSLQVAANRRFSKGLSFSLSYTWSKAMDTANVDLETTQPYNTRRYDYRLASFDHQHAFGAGFVYDVPDISRYLGRHWLARSVLGNWQISGITSIITGAPSELAVGITNVTGPNRITGSFTEMPRFYLRGDPQPGPNGIQIDPNAFVVPLPGDYGPWSRQYLRGPGINNQNLSLFKNFPFGGEDGTQIQLRFEMFNAFNHTQFTAFNIATNLVVPNPTLGLVGGPNVFNDYSRVQITNNLRPAGSTEPLGRYFGEYTDAASPRIIQLGVKLYF